MAAGAPHVLKPAPEAPHDSFLLAEVAREAGIPAEALVMEMYMSGEMETVFEGFRRTGFFRAAEDHGPTAL